MIHLINGAFSLGSLSVLMSKKKAAHYTGSPFFVRSKFS